MRSIFFCPVLATGMVLSSLCFSSPAINDDSLTVQVVQSQIILNSTNIESATVIKGEENRYSVQIKLKPSAADELKRITNVGIGKIANMIFNGKIISTATIQGELGSDFLVTGFPKNEAIEFASSIKKHN